MSKTTTPKKILDAIFPDVVTVAGLRLQPVTALHYLALEKLENPLVVRDLETTSKDLVEAIMVLSLAPNEVREIMQQGTLFVENAVLELAERIKAADLPGISQALLQHIYSAFDTAVPSATEGEVRPLAPASSLPPSTPG